MSRRDALEKKIRELPREPGVYTFLDESGEALYVGKAGSLRDRVRSYLNAGLAPRIANMVEEASDVEVVLVGSDAEAYLLEASLIRERRPKYNVMLTDDKRYPWVLVSAEDHPRIDIVRSTEEPGDLYGPFPDVGTARALVNVLREAFGIRDCKRELPQGCIKHDMGLCLGPCFREIEETYAEAVGEVQKVLRGSSGPAIAVLEERMNEAAATLEYEKAARLRDRIAGIQALLDKQAIFATRQEDVDAVALAIGHERSVAVVLPRRGGRVVDAQPFTLPGGHEGDAGELLAEFLARYYEHRPQVPRHVLTSHEPASPDTLLERLAARAGRKVEVRVPVRGAGRRLVALAEKNAAYQLARAERARGPDPGVHDLAERLRLETPPRRLECIDISHHGGKGVVGSLVTFTDGRPEKRGYRHFGLSEEKNDDVAAIGEVVRRRLSRLAEEGRELPDLLLVDGGRGQVEAARAAADELGLPVTILGLAKREEEVFRPGWQAPVVLPRDAPGLRMLQRARDEAHRFAITFGRRRREKALTSSLLDAVPGVGPTLRKRLLRRFGSVDGVAKATEEELAEVEGVGPALARRIKVVLGGPG